jgi:hypothetical protein
MCICGGGVGDRRCSFSRRGREIDMLGVYRMVSLWVALEGSLVIMVW